jgi:chaperonin GroEL
MAKLIKYGDQAKQAIKAGVDKAANAVRVTLGPSGRTVIIDRGFGAPVISDDGVTVAKAIELEDKFENIGASLIQEVANKTNEAAGDGTTTATVLAQKMIEVAFDSGVDFRKANDIKRGMDKAVRFVVDKLNKMKKDVKSSEEIEQIATIASLDTEVGRYIAEAMEEVGKDGIITVEEGQTIGLEKEVVKGMRFDKGFVSPYMTTNPERMEAVWENPYILITDKKVSVVQDILPLLEKVVQSGKKDLVIIAEDIDSEALTTFILNKIRGTFNVLAVKAPGFGDRRKETLQDIAVLTGGRVITEEIGLKIDAAELTDLGQARRVISTKDHTTIIDGQGTKIDIDARIEQIRAERANVKSDYDKQKLDERLARLAGGIGVIKVGAFTETEMKAKKFKIEDALNATKAAVEEGIIIGGGSALAKVAPMLEAKIAEGEMFSANQAIGARMVRTALEAPLRQLSENTGVDADDVVRYVQGGSATDGYDFSKYDEADWSKGQGDLMKAGIVDPVKVTRFALENAVSIASTLVTSEAIIVEKPEEKKPAMGGMGDGGMGMM